MDLTLFRARYRFADTPKQPEFKTMQTSISAETTTLSWQASELLTRGLYPVGCVNQKVLGQMGRNPSKITFRFLLFIGIDASRPEVAGELADVIPLVIGDVEKDFGARDFWEAHGAQPAAVKLDFLL